MAKLFKAFQLFKAFKYGNAFVTDVYKAFIEYVFGSCEPVSNEYVTDGVELVVNGGFDTDSDWIKGSGWTILDGVASRSDATSNSYIGQTITLVANTTYKFKFIANSISGTGSIYTPSTAETIYTYTEAGEHIAYFTPSNTQSYILGWYGIGSADIEIDNISIQKVTQLPNNRYLTNQGTFDNAPMYSGRGLEVQSVNSTVLPLVINSTVQTVAYMKDGVTVYEEGSQYVGTYNVSTDGVYSNFIFYDGIFTTAQKAELETQPEKFLMENKASFVEAFPMVDDDEFVRGVIGYSDGSELLSWGDFNTIVGFTTDTSVSIVNNECVWNTGAYVYGLTDTTASITSNTLYLVSFDITSYTAGSIFPRIGSANGNSVSEIGTYKMVLKSIDPEKLKFRAGASGFVGTIDNISVKQLSGIYPITNWVTGMNKTGLPYGLQASKLEIVNNVPIAYNTDKLSFYGSEKFTIPTRSTTTDITLQVYPKQLVGNILSGAISLDTTGLNINDTNDIILSNKTINGTVDVGDGFIGNITIYKEDLV